MKLMIDSPSVASVMTRAAEAAGVTPLRADFDAQKAPWSELLEERKRGHKILRHIDLDNVSDAVFEAINDQLNWLSDEVDRRDENRTKDPLPAFDPRRPMGPDGTDGESTDADFALRSNQRFAHHPEIRSSFEAEYTNLGLGNYLRSMVLGAKSDQEKRALSEGTDSAGGYTVPSVLSAELIDRLRARNTAIRAGAQTIPLTSDTHHIAKVATDPSPSWKAENAQQSDTDLTFERIAFTPQVLMVLIRVSRELLEDSVNINTALPNIIAASMAQELDRVVYLGSGSSNEPAGLDNIANVQSLDHGSAAIADFTPFTQARRMLLNENVERIGPWVMAPDLEEDVANLTDSNNQPLQHPGVLDPFETLTTSKLPTNLGAGSDEGVIYGGDMNQVAIGLRNDVRVEVLRERYADYLQYGFVAYMRADVQAIHPKALIRITGVTT